MSWLCPYDLAGSLLLDHLGVERVHLYAEPTGHFPHKPEPLKENLTELCDAVKQHGAHAGFAQNPDADRLAIVTKTGPTSARNTRWFSVPWRGVGTGI